MKQPKIAHIFSVPFTGFGAQGGYRGDKWLESRIRIFKNFVIPSLVAQTNRNFVLWCQFRREDETNPQIIELWKSLNGIRGFSCVFTFFGVCLYDDKYPDEIARNRLLRSLSSSLRDVAPAVAEADWVYLTCQPSDDLYTFRAVEELQAVKPKKGLALVWPNGYICNYATKEIAHYNPDTTPPFATVIFPKDVFIDAQKHFDYIGPYKSHEFIGDRLTVRWMPGRGYLVGTHGANISTVWNHPYRGKELDGREKENVWLAFGIWDADPVPFRKGLHLWLRMLVNLFPKPIHDFLRKNYHKYARRNLF